MKMSIVHGKVVQKKRLTSFASYVMPLYRIFGTFSKISHQTNADQSKKKILTHSISLSLSHTHLVPMAIIVTIIIILTSIPSYIVYFMYASTEA